MSALSSEFADARLQELIEEYDGDYWRALTEFEWSPDDETYYYDGAAWKFIPGFSRYKVSTDGRVMSYMHSKPRILSPWSNTYGHLYVELSADDGSRHKFTIHSLVAGVFCHNPDPVNYNVVRHMDDNPANNNMDNLRFGTQAMNYQDMVDHDRDFKIPVYCYETDTTYRSGAVAARELNVSKASVTNCCKGKIGYAKGYHICYEKDKEEKLSDLEDWLDDSKSNGMRKVRAINLENGDTYIFGSRKEASRALNITNCGISSVITGHLKHTHGWYFENYGMEAANA